MVAVLGDQGDRKAPARNSLSQDSPHKTSEMLEMLAMLEKLAHSARLHHTVSDLHSRLTCTRESLSCSVLQYVVVCCGVLRSVESVCDVHLCHSQVTCICVTLIYDVRLSSASMTCVSHMHLCHCLCVSMHLSMCVVVCECTCVCVCVCVCACVCV